MITELCKRLDGTTCGRNVDKESSEVGWSHVGDATSPAGPDCTAPPVCWTCGEAIDLGGGAERAFHIVRISDVSGAPILGDSADGTKPEPGQERCRRQKATECAQGRELCDEDQCVEYDGDDPNFDRHVLVCKSHQQCGDHHDDPKGSPCLGPECKAHPSTGGQIIEQRERVRDAEASAALAADSDRDGTGSKRKPGIVERCRATAANVQAWAVGKPPDSLRAAVLHDLREAAAHIEGLEAELEDVHCRLMDTSEGYNAANGLSKETMRQLSNAQAENQRLREALDGMVDAFMRLNDKHGDRYAEEDTCKEFAVARAIQREALKETP